MRKPIIAGNWKMNKDINESVELINNIKSYKLDSAVEAVVCVPFIDISEAAKLLEGTNIALGAQNMYYEEKGAFTGEISPTMLKNAGVQYVILGHSERREIFGETDDLINKKVISAIKHGLNPILCCGENLSEREASEQFDKVHGQITKNLKDVTEEELKNVVIAYEPIWAIGTGKTASSDEAEEMLAYIRKLIGEMYGEDAAKAILIQYGGSVKPDNIKELMNKENIDGALIGGAALEAESFVSLVNFGE